MDKPQTVAMPDVAIPYDAVLRRLGYPPEVYEITGKAGQILSEETERARRLIRPAGVFQLLEIQSNDKRAVTFHTSDFVITSSQVARMLHDANRAAFFAATIGPKLEERVSSLSNDGEATRAVILDAIGSETADAVADRLHRTVLSILAEEAQCRVTPRFSPGYGDWPLTAQSDLIDLCGGVSIGISVTPSSLMIPRKSISAIAGWIPSPP